VALLFSHAGLRSAAGRRFFPGRALAFRLDQFRHSKFDAQKQIEELEADKRRLLLAKEVALSPAEIKKAAKKLGLTEMTASNIGTLRSGGEKTERPQPIKISEEKPKLKTKPAEKAPEAKKEEKNDKTRALKEKAQAAKKKSNFRARSRKNKGFRL
jgi:hypothetical protein